MTEQYNSRKQYTGQAMPASTFQKYSAVTPFHRLLSFYSLLSGDKYIHSSLLNGINLFIYLFT